MFLIALTGGIATGKTLASHHLVKLLEAPFVSSDALVHQILSEPEWVARIGERFGPECVRDGAVDRARLGARVFASETERKALEALLHPEVLRRVQAWTREHAERRVALVEVPLLYEVDFPMNQDFSVVVACSRATQIARLQQRNGLSAQDAEARLSAQLPISTKVERGDVVIWNDGTEQALRRQCRLAASCIENKLV